MISAIPPAVTIITHIHSYTTDVRHAVFIVVGLHVVRLSMDQAATASI